MEPFAHLSTNQALDVDLYRQLERAFPPDDRFLRGLDHVASNQAVRIPAGAIIDNREFSPDWREFFRYHTSDAFWHDILRVMGPAIHATHPHLESQSGKRLDQWKVVRRGSGEKGDVELDALFVVNTPVKTMSSVRPAHVDKETEIFAGLLYMRPKDDPTDGGDLVLYRFKGRPAFGGHYAPLSSVNEIKRIGYDANRLVAFVNSASSIHGVTPRPPTDRYRRYVNLIASTPFAAFQLPRMSVLGQLQFWLDRRKTKAHGIMAKA